MITSEDECLNMRNVKFKFYFFPKMRYKFLMFITTVLRLLVWYNYSADHSDLEALTGPKHYLKSFHYPWQEPRICGEKMRKVILVAYWGSRAPVKLYRGGTGLACRSVKDGG